MSGEQLTQWTWYFPIQDSANCLGYESARNLNDTCTNSVTTCTKKWCVSIYQTYKFKFHLGSEPQGSSLVKWFGCQTG